MNNEKPKSRWRDVTLPIEIIKEDRRFQPRELSLSDHTVAKYALAMRKGDEFPPVLVARVGAEMFVIDGFHRLQASRTSGRTEIAAKLATMTEQAAVSAAINANALHGLNLSREDKQRCFKMYCDAGLHLDPAGNVKSLRTIRSDLGNIAWPNTISSWLRKAEIEPTADDSGPNVSCPEEPLFEDEIDEMEKLQILDTHLSHLVQGYHLLESPRNRSTIRRRLADLVDRLAEEDGDHFAGGRDSLDI